MKILLDFFKAFQQRDAEFAVLESKIPKSGIELINSPSMLYIKEVFVYIIPVPPSLRVDFKANECSISC
ncbi:unnamed protein product [Moneuplotes crassus]|uniref:Uncharacterized protein n=1 Tax=Euplotes crassus TaxID=5936 RepID=A0AAD2D200_EUPCR|nr:unnamed protein product [Moneuplotes crassus]